MTGFLILLLPWKWERADLWQKVGIWRRIELDAALAASPRQITRRRKGGVKKGKGKREGRGQLDKNRRESNKEWGINKGKGEEKECSNVFYYWQKVEMERNWSLEMVEKMWSIEEEG